MQQVITADHARQLRERRESGRVPVEYEQAVKALDACMTLDDTHRWTHKADALAAWAKIYHDGKILRQAKALKLRAFRRMGELARELHPRLPKKGEGSGRGSVLGSGHRTALKALGLSDAEVDAARLLAELPYGKFLPLLRVRNPLAPTTLRELMRRDGDDSWSSMQRTLMSARSQMRARTPRSIRALSDVERDGARALVDEVMEWLTSFKAHRLRE